MLTKPIQIIFLLLLASIFFTAKAQVIYLESEIDERAREIIENAQYIFDGKFAEGSEANSYFSKDSSEVFGSMLIEVSRVYKGDLKPGTIELLYTGANITYEKNGKKYSLIKSHGGGPQIYKNTHYIFLAKESNIPPNPIPYKMAVDNTQKIEVEHGNEGLIIPQSITTSHNILGPNKKEFNTEKELFDFLKSFSGVNISDDVYMRAKDYNPYRSKEREKKKISNGGGH